MKDRPGSREPVVAGAMLDAMLDRVARCQEAILHPID